MPRGKSQYCSMVLGSDWHGFNLLYGKVQKDPVIPERLVALAEVGDCQYIIYKDAGMKK